MTLHFFHLIQRGTALANGIGQMGMEWREMGLKWRETCGVLYGMRGSESRKRLRWKPYGRWCNSSGCLAVLSRLPVRHAPLPSAFSLPHLFCTVQVLNRVDYIQMTEALLNRQPFLPPSLALRPLSARAGQLSGRQPPPPFRGGTSRRRAGDRALCSAVSWKLKPPGQMFWVTATLGARALAQRAGLRDI